MNYCDLHCDTPLELYLQNEHLNGNALDVTCSGFKGFEHYLQLAAYCPPEKLSDREGLELFFRMADYFKRELSEHGCAFCTDADGIAKAYESKTPAFVLTLEDARVLDGSIAALHKLFDARVRVLTPLWSGESCIGGSHESVLGLTDFGREVVTECAKLGIITDVSHASPRSADEIINIAVRHGKAVMASHSCAYGVYPHSRNLHDEHLKAIAALGGVVGVNTYPPHLTGGDATLNDIAEHISYFADTVGESYVALGCDFDGMGIHTKGCENVSLIPSLKDRLIAHGFSSESAEKILFSNAYTFIKNNITNIK